MRPYLPVRCDWGFAHSRAPCAARGCVRGPAAARGCITLLDFSLSSIGWRRGVGRGGAFLLVSPLLGPLPTRSSRGEDGELDAALPFAAVGGDAACPRPKSRTTLCA